MWLQIGDPFDGLRFGPPLQFKWAAQDTEIFQDLELVIEDAYKTIANQPTSAWKRLAEEAHPPKINGRPVRLNLIYGETNDHEEILVMRARLPFRGWPLGGRVVVEGWRRVGAGAWTPLATGELEKTW